jgi:hypothetical protein
MRVCADVLMESARRAARVTFKKHGIHPIPETKILPLRSALLPDADSPSDVLSPNDQTLHPKQGALGDCFLLAALKSEEHLEVYRGSRDVTSGGKTRRFYKFRFFSSVTKSFLEVEVNDDVLCYTNNTPVFAQLSDHGWVALMEKAYALFIGGFEKLNEGGHCADAFLALTGKKASNLDVRLQFVQALAATAQCGVDEVARQMAGYVRAALARGLVLTVESVAARPDYRSDLSPHNIVGGHAYSVVELRNVPDKHGRPITQLVLFNPWNDGKGTAEEYRNCGTAECQALQKSWQESVDAEVKDGLTLIPWTKLINHAEFHTVTIWPAVAPFKLKMPQAPLQERPLARQPFAQQRGVNRPNYHHAAFAAAAAAPPPAKDSIALKMATMGFSNDDDGDDTQPLQSAYAVRPPLEPLVQQPPAQQHRVNRSSHRATATAAEEEWLSWYLSRTARINEENQPQRSARASAAAASKQRFTSQFSHKR